MADQFANLLDLAGKFGIGDAPQQPVEMTSPAFYFANRFPNVADKYGDAVQVKPNRHGQDVVVGLSESFFAAALGESGSPEAPTVFISDEGRFYKYLPAEGIYVERSEAALSKDVADLLRDCVRDCDTTVDVSNLQFRLSSTAATKGVVERAKGILGQTSGFFNPNNESLIACANGMLVVEKRTLLPFSPGLRRRNKLAVPYDPQATCSRFISMLLLPALSPEDIDMLQRWCGLVLVGVNLSQAILILSGTSGAGKGTLVRVINGILGASNIASLRTGLLANRFEVGRLLGRTLLYGADVPANFLNCPGASVLKALTGGDPIVVELKGTNARPEIICRFNAIVTCNSRLKVRLEGDHDAWRRRLRIIRYQNPPPTHVIADLSEVILREEGPGVLNWMLAGLDRLRADHWQLKPTTAQQEVVDDLLLESESYIHFVREWLFAVRGMELTHTEAYAGYLRFCRERGWTALSPNDFGAVIDQAVFKTHGAPARNDILDADGKAKRGWKGITCRA